MWLILQCNSKCPFLYMHVWTLVISIHNSSRLQDLSSINLCSLHCEMKKLRTTSGLAWVVCLPCGNPRQVKWGFVKLWAWKLQRVSKSHSQRTKRKGQQTAIERHTCNIHVASFSGINYEVSHICKKKGWNSLRDLN